MPKHGGWPAARARLIANQTRSDTGCDELLEAFEWFRSYLEPRGWPIWEEGRHLAAQFQLSYNGAPPEGVRLYRLLRQFDGEPGLCGLVERLGAAAWTEYFGALLELEMAGRMRRAGLPTRLVERRKEAPERVPDFLIVSDQREVAFECTAMCDTLPERKAEYVIDRLFTYPRRHRIFRGAILVQWMSGALADDAFDRIDEVERAVEEVAATNAPVIIERLGTVTPISGAMGPTVTVDGGLVVGDYSRRLIHASRSLRKKVKRGQLNGWNASVVAIRLRDVLLPWREGLLERVDVAAYDVAEWLQDYGSSPSAVLLFEEVRGTYPGYWQHDAPFYRAVRNLDEDGSIRVALLIRNPARGDALTQREFDRLVGPEMLW
jgi:hypothetical protein